ncbi:MAG TPA: LytTR family DNA-binding domain-containing protein [Chryseolinea sp.]|nr:LytTR family DNA-binding domain-containing protein [Chryseolinea sp.]
MKCLIIDDEPVARMGLQEYIQETDFLELTAQCENPLQASKFVNDEMVDLIYLDIHMPKVSGIEFLRTLRNPPLVILTTAFSEYALEGYSLNVTDYLMKPITLENFLRASQKAFEIFQMKKYGARSHEHAYFFIKCDSKYEKVLFSEVTYIEALQNYVVIHTADRKLITYITLTGLQEQLPADQFVKVHKSFIVSIARIKSIDGNEISIGSTRIPISRNLKEAVVGRILGNNLLKR